MFRLWCVYCVRNFFNYVASRFPRRDSGSAFGRVLGSCNFYTALRMVVGLAFTVVPTRRIEAAVWWFLPQDRRRTLGDPRDAQIA